MSQDKSSEKLISVHIPVSGVIFPFTLIKCEVWLQEFGDKAIS
jgi:hypothetical protein